MIVRELFAKMGLDWDSAGFAEAITVTDALKFGLQKAGEAVKKLAGEFVDSVVSTARYGDELIDLAQRTGIGTTALQELAHAAAKSGSSSEGLIRAMQLLSRTVQAAGDGSEDAARAFTRIGVTTKNADGSLKSADQLLLELSDKFRAMPDGMKKTALAMSLFGKSGAELIPLLNEGSENIGALRAEAHQLGLVLDEETVKEGDRLYEALGRIDDLSVGLKRTLARELIPVLGDVAEEFVEWAKQNREVIKTKVDGFARMVAAGLRTLAGAAKFAATNLRLLGIVVASVLTPLLYANAGAIMFAASWYGALGVAAVVAAAKAVVAWVAAAAPFIALAGAVMLVLLILEDIWVSLTGGEGLLDELWAKWSSFVTNWVTSPSEGDHWLIVFLKSVGLLFSTLDTAIPEALDFWRDLFRDFFSWLWDSIKTIFNPMNWKVSGISVYRDGDPEARKRRPEVKTIREWTAPARESFAGFSNDFVQGLAHGQLDNRFGGGASPMASVQTSARPTVKVSAPTMKAEIAIHQQPGQNADDVADALARKLDDFFQGKMNETAAATQ